MNPTPLHKTLDQELNALLRGVSLECLACGEFVLRSGRAVSCPECGSHLRDARDSAGAGLQFRVQAG
jgi:Zn finger protein HypA/HybF involved in hydrogenase expression